MWTRKSKAFKKNQKEIKVVAKGGRRFGAGRKKGSVTKRKAAVKIQAIAEGITPAEVMQKTMEHHYHAGRYDQAATIAKDLAPYIHPRKSSVQVSGGLDLSNLSDVELDRRLAEIEAQLAHREVAPPALEAQSRTSEMGL